MDESIKDKTRETHSLGREQAEAVLPRLPRWGGGRGREISGLGANSLADALPQGASSQRTLNLDHRYRRLLGVADLTACLIAMTVCIPLLGGGNDRLRVGVIAGLPLVILISKLLGLYDRDEILLRKSTLDEAPKLFQLATLFSCPVDRVGTANAGSSRRRPGGGIVGPPVCGSAGLAPRGP